MTSSVLLNHHTHCWRSMFPFSGPYWTQVLFSWKRNGGLKVYINGTFTAGDTAGSVSESYGDLYPDLVIGTGNDRAYGHYVTGAFDEFVIWERALTPSEILLYYRAAVGRTSRSIAQCGISTVASPLLQLLWRNGLWSSLRPFPEGIPSTAFLHDHKMFNQTNVPKWMALLDENIIMTFRLTLDLAHMLLPNMCWEECRGVLGHRGQITGT